MNQLHQLKLPSLPQLNGIKKEPIAGVGVEKTTKQQTQRKIE